MLVQELCNHHCGLFAAVELGTDCLPEAEEVCDSDGDHEVYIRLCRCMVCVLVLCIVLSS